MDYNHPDHFQMSTPIIKLKSSDGEVFQVEVKVAKLSLHFKEMLDDLGVVENEVISIPPNGPKISGEILGKIIQWANHHKDDPAESEEDEKEEKPTDDISSWDAEFLQVDVKTLFQILRAANYLNVKGLFDVTCKTVAKVIQGMTAGDVRRTFHIQNDFNLDEAHRVLEEYKWCERVNFVGRIGIPVNRSAMDEIPTDSIQNMNHEDHQVMMDNLSNSVVVRKIFQYFSDTDLLKLSFVNKMWNYEARSVLRKRGNLFAHIRCTNNESCRENVEAFLSAIQQMNIVPFSGTKIDIRHSSPPFSVVGCPSKGLCSFDDEILDRLPLRKVSVNLGEECLNSPGFLLAKKIVQYFSEALDELSLKFHITGEEMKFNMEDVVGQCKFPRLKVLKVLNRKYDHNAAHTNFVNMLVPRAPNLQQLHTGEPIRSAFNAVEGTSTSAVVVYTEWISAPFDEISEAKIGTCKLEKIRLLYTGPEFNFERFSQITPALLQASSTTIRSMLIDAVLAVPLMCYGIIFDKVKYLDMHINYPELELLEPRIWTVVKDFDFSRLFPNLNNVSICGDYSTILPPDDTTDRIIERANAILPLPRPDPVANIKSLSLCNCDLSIATIQFFAETFPSIEDLNIVEYGAIPPFGSIWKYWVGLKHLKIREWMIPNDGNLDSVFCGIFPEEVAELRQKDDEYLKSVHIVPVMPAITCLKNLRALSLCRRERDREGYTDDGTFIFSKVTGFIAFKRCPALAVRLRFRGNGSIEATRHLEPFASVTWQRTT